MFRALEGQRKGSTVYESGNYVYRKEKMAAKLYVRCTTKDCPGRAVIDGEVLTVSSDHNHDPLSPSRFRMLEAKSSMKRAAEESATSLKDIYDNTCRDMNIGGSMTYYHIESTLRKRRRKTFPGIPRTTREAADGLTGAGPEMLKYTTNFIEAVEADNDVALMFMDGGRESLELFRNYNGPLHADGTFYVTPQPFNSLLVIHLEYKKHTFPIFYFLLSKRTESTYTAVFNRVAATLAPLSASLTHCMTDFETALMKACERVFQVPVHGCWFHYSQAIFKKVQKLGLIHRFRNVEGNASDFKKLIHCYMALPLLPTDAIEGAVRELSTHIIPLPPPEQRRLQQFRLYISAFWLQKVTPNRMSVFGLSRRSNNSIESFNATLKRKIQKAHPNIFLFIEHLNNLISAKLSDMRLLENGQQLSRRPPRQHLVNEDRLRVLEAQHSGGTVTSIAFIQKACATFHRYANNFDVGSSSDEDDAPAADADSDDNEQPPGNAEDNAEDINRNSLCPVCLITNRNSVLNPCGHTACYQCANTIRNMLDPANKCHECRAPIVSVIRVFGMGSD